MGRSSPAREAAPVARRRRGAADRLPREAGGAEGAVDGGAPGARVRDVDRVRRDGARFDAGGCADPE